MISLIFPFIVSFLGIQIPIPKPAPKVLASHEFSMEDRYGNTFVNNVFKDNILLTLDYLKGVKVNSDNVDWKVIEEPFSYSLVLKPGQTFAFHDDVLPQFENKISMTTNSHFNSTEGFKSDGWLVGDGVCHLASLMYWTAKDAGLDALAPTRHDFAPVPEVPREYGTAIYEVPGGGYSNQEQNLYITNNKNKEIVFNFDYNGKELKIEALEN